MNKTIDSRIDALEKSYGQDEDIKTRIANMAPLEREKMLLENFSKEQGLDHLATREEREDWLLKTYQKEANGDTVPPEPLETATITEQLRAYEAIHAWHILRTRKARDFIHSRSENRA
jgi:hypothetical protein